jgi:hypothetical protein
VVNCLLDVEGPQLVGHLQLTKDLGGSSRDTVSAGFCMYGLESPFLYRVVDTHFVPIGVGGFTSLRVMYIYFL